MRLADATWAEIAALELRRTVPILPVGAVEAHGPHLPLTTDVIIAEAMAAAAVAGLARLELIGLVLPAVAYTPAPFADAFAGTTSIPAELLTATVVAIGAAWADRGCEVLAIANAHFDPANVTALREAAAELGRARPELTVAYPDLTRRRWAERLTDEFRSGACHAGRYEGSIVLAERPELVDVATMATLPPHTVSLSDGIRAGRRSFGELGGERAYFGSPSEATADEGRETVRRLGELLVEAIEAARL